MSQITPLELRELSYKTETFQNVIVKINTDMVSAAEKLDDFVEYNSTEHFQDLYFPADDILLMVANYYRDHGFNVKVTYPDNYSYINVFISWEHKE